MTATRQLASGAGACADGVDASPEPGKVRQMFDGIAGSYDRLNDLMTAGLHHRWREMGVMLARVGPGDSALDVCCGTGDFAFALRRAVGPRGPGGRRGRLRGDARRRPGEVRPQPALRGVPQGDVLDLPFPDGRDGRGGEPVGFDACTVGFGIRNVPDIVRAFSEMRRVCRPGGRVVCLEITQPQIPVFKQFYGCGSTMPCPCWAGWPPATSSAYSYLPASVKRFPDPDELKGLMEEAGLRNVRYEILAGGSSPSITRRVGAGGVTAHGSRTVPRATGGS